MSFFYVGLLSLLRVNTLTLVLLLMYSLLAIVLIGYYFMSVDKSKRNSYVPLLQGKWVREGISDEDEPWQISFTFQQNNFEVDAMPQYHLKGKFRVVREIEQLLILHLYQLSGDDVLPDGNPYEVRELRIGVRPQYNQLIIDDRAYEKA